MQVSPKGVPGVSVDAIYIGLTVVGFGAFVALFSVLVGVELERWRDVHGVERPTRWRRTSGARTAVGMVLVIMGASVGTGIALAGGVWIAVGAVVVIGTLVGGIVVLRTGRTLPEPAPPADLPAHHEGLAYFWHCRLPAHMLDNGRVVSTAVVCPPGAVVLLVLGKWWGAIVFGALGAFAWWALWKAPIKSVPTRGPCLRAE